MKTAHLHLQRSVSKDNELEPQTEPSGVKSNRGAYIPAAVGALSSAPRPSTSPAPGFTLIELMVVIVIVAILSSIAYPSYVEYVQKGRRVDAQTAMLELAQFMERYYTTNNSYTGATLPEGVTNRVGTYYTVELSEQTAQSYTLSAAPKGAQSDDKCGSLTLTNTGAKSAGTTGCWH